VRSVSVQIAEDGLRDNGVMLQVSEASGLRLGQLVVTAGANLLREGQKVRLPTAATSSTGPTGSTGSTGSRSPALPRP